MPALTFPVADRPLTNQPIAPLPPASTLASLFRFPIEQFALSDDRLVLCNDAHPFAQAAHDAFYKHYPLTITPDDIWFCIAQGFSQYVQRNAESLRHHFVQHEGQKRLTVVRTDFHLGRPNPWPEVFTEFSHQIAQHVGQELRDSIVADFSTTTDFHRAATEVLLMDTFQPYFEYEMLAGCGIPAITLTGAPDDWRNIRRRASLLAQYGLEEWINSLLPVLDQIESSSRGHHDRDFWNSFFRYQSGSGGSAMTGWINALFPYLKEWDGDRPTGKLIPNPYMKTWQADIAHANESRGKHARWKDYEEIRDPILLDLPAGIASAPVRLLDARTNQEHDLKFIAGMFGVAQDPATLNLQTSFGWAIVHNTFQPPPKPARGKRAFFRE